MAVSEAWRVVLGSAAFWLLASLLVGLLANRLPLAWLQSPPWFAPHRARTHRARTQGGRLAAVGAAPPGIRIWKRWIPDAGPALPGGIAKASLVRRDPVALQRLLIETRRAELVHWALLAAALLTPLALPAAAAAGNLLFAAGFNLPCLLLQRFNRRRLQRILARAQGPRSRASSSSSAASPASSA